jgi:hypothetical protein
VTTYYLKAFDGATGAALAFLSEFQEASGSFEFSDVGSLTFKYPRSGANFSSLTANRVEVGVFQDGVEMDDGRYTVVSSSYDEVEQTGMVDFTCLSIINRLKRALVYSADGSVTQGTDQVFTSATPGGILKALFDQNFARGTGRVMRTITYASFSNTLDSNGNAWAFNIPGPLTYTVGVNYLDVIRHLVNSGAIEVRMVGRDLRVYNPGTMGVDKTVVSEPVVLRQGRELAEAPVSKTNEGIAAIALIAGDEGILRQETDSSVATAWGEDETFISQGGIRDTTTLGILAQQEIDRSSAVRIEYTHKVIPEASPWRPYADYKVSDYIYTARNGTLDRLRVRQMVLDFDPTRSNSVSLVLNDKFLEREIVTARRIDGILGGATATGSIAVPAPPVIVDTTVPNSPASLSAISAVYVGDDGRSLSQVSLAWPAVTQNTDTSTLTDLSHYETQWHSDQVFATTPPSTVTPGRDLESMTRLFDRRGKGYGWLGGDGGASTRATSGRDFWAFADTNLGIADQEGKITSQWSFPHNTWVLTKHDDPSIFDAKWGYGNKFSDDDAFFKTTVGLWQADANCSVARSTSTFHYGTASLQVTATAGGDATARIAAGAFAYPVTANTQYSFFCRARSVGTARSVALGIRWYDAANALISTTTSSNQTGTNSEWRRHLVVGTAPSNAVRAAPIVIFRSAGAAQVFNVDAAQLSQGDATYYGWNDPGRAFLGGPCAVLHPEELGGAELTDLNDIFWVDACTTVGGKVLVAYTRYNATGVFKNSIYIAQYDGTTHAFESLTTWSTSDTFNWWTAVTQDASFLYAYGVDNSLGGGSRAVHIMRVPIGNVLAGTKEWWNGSTWTTTRASSAAIYTGYSAQFGGVALIGTTWFAMVTEYGGSTMKYLTAPNPQGTWTMQGSFYTQPEMGSGLVAYFPRIHPQLASNAGIPMSYSVNGTVNGDNSLDNIRYYAPKFLIGPAATIAAAVPSTDWSESRMIDSGVLVDYIGNIPPGSNFEARVRAVDNSGNRSTWRTSSAIKTTADTTAPNKPSIPIVSSAFKGIRVEWDGLDFQGGPMPGDWLFTEVHVSEVANFQPGPLTKVDVIRTRGGGVFPYQGLEYNRTYYARFIAVDFRGNRSDPSDAASASTEQLVNIDELATKLITGAKIADSTIAVQSLTVAAFEPSICPNGGMEQEATNASGTGTGLPYGWNNTGWLWGAGGTLTYETSAPINGAKSLKATMAAATDGMVIGSVKFPVEEGRLLAVGAKFKTSRSIATSNVIQIQLATGVTEPDAGSFPGANSTWTTLATSSGSGAIQTIEGQIVIPANHKYAALFLVCYQAGDGSGYNVLWDDVVVSPVGGSAFIADASILNAKIANLAVDNAKIANMSVGKLTAGTLSADMTVSARIKTADTGARVEINSAGLEAYNSSGAKTVEIASATGSAVMVGTFRTAFAGSGQPHTLMQDSGDRTTTWWYDASELNPAFMNTPADVNGDPRVGINTGIHEYYTSVDARGRLFLNTIGGIQLETYRVDDATKFIGGRLSLGPNGSQFDHRQSSGTQNGGAMYVDGNGFIIARNSSGTSNGAVLAGSANDLSIIVDNTGTPEIEILMEDDGMISFFRGKFPNFSDLGTRQAVFSGGITATSGTSWAVSYGSTKTGAGVFPIATPKFGGAVAWAVTTFSASGFTITAAGTTSGNIFFWCIRV